MGRHGNAVSRAYALTRIFFFISFFACLAWAANADIPLPPDAEQKLNKDSSMGPITSNISTYTTDWNADKLTNFYKKEMLKNGWTEKRDLTFLKGDDFVSIIPSQNKFKGNKTLFNIVRGTMPAKEAIMSGEKAQPDKLDFMPVYPASTQLLLWDTPTGMVAGYKTQSSIQEVLFFYKAGMLNFGWALAEEAPVTEKVIGPSCPGCEKMKRAGLPPNEPAPKVSGSVFSARLAFKRGEGESCAISLFQNKVVLEPPPAALEAKDKQAAAADKGPAPDIENQTQIMVTYNDFRKK